MLYQLENELPAKAPLLIVSFQNRFDSGKVESLAVSQLYASLPTKTLITFNTDELLNYQDAGIMVEINGWMVSHVELPEITLDLLHDDEGTPLLILRGTEPHLRLEAFSQTIRQLCEQMGVELVITLQGMPMPVPHTRAPFVNLVSTDEQLASEQPAVSQKVIFNGGAQQYLLHRLLQSGLGNIQFFTSVPVYLKDYLYSPGALALLKRVATLLNVKLPIGNLEETGALENYQLLEELVNGVDMGKVIQLMEEQYDEMILPGQIAAPGEPVDLTEILSEDYQIDTDQLVGSIEEFLKRNGESTTEGK